MSGFEAIRISNFLDPSSLISPSIYASLLSPKLLESLIGELSLWKTININLNIHQDKSQSSAVISAQNDRLKGVGQEKTVLLLPESEDSENLVPSSLPFSTGSYFIINKPSWWESASENDQGTRLGPNLCVYPTLPGRPQRLRTLISEREFTVDIQANRVSLEEERRSGMQRHKPVEFPESNTAEIEGDVKWIFTRYASSELVRFDDYALREIAISFDPEIVKEAVLIKRERIGSQRKYRDDYYLLVFKDE